MKIATGSILLYMLGYVQVIAGTFSSSPQFCPLDLTIVTICPHNIFCVQLIILSKLKNIYIYISLYKIKKKKKKKNSLGKFKIGGSQLLLKEEEF